MNDSPDAEHRHHQEPKGHDGTERLADPRRAAWLHRNSAIKIATADGSTYGWKAGVTMLRPSSAERTDIAGVIAPSP